MDYDDNSPFVNDMITLDVYFEQIRAWVRCNRDLTKKEIITMMRKIEAKADQIERSVKASGYTYFKGGI